MVASSACGATSETGREVIRRRDRVRELGRGAECHDDLLVLREGERAGVAGEGLAVHEDRQGPAGPVAGPTDAVAIEPHAPDVEEVAEREIADHGRLDVDDPGRVMGVDRGEVARGSVYPDVGRDRDRLAVDEEIKVLMGVEGLPLGGERRQANGRQPRPEL
jgi:hypothetical protein